MSTASVLYRQFYRNQQLLERLTYVVSQYPQADAERLLQKFLSHRHMLPSASLDYTRLVAFLKKDFQGLDLHGEDLSAMHLEGFNFAEAQLQGAKLSGANLNHANLTRANLTGARCHWVQMQHAFLERAILCEAHCMYADLSHAYLDGANLTRTNFTEATLSYASVKQATLAYARLTASTWYEADLEYACLNHAEASKASFAEANLRHTTVTYATMKEAILTGAKCSYSSWYGTNLQAASLRWADFSMSDLRGVNIEDAYLYDCNCVTAAFGDGLHYNSKTVIDSSDHNLISMVLLSCAHTPQQKQFALYVRHERSLCWSEFTRLLLYQSTEMAAWVKEALRTVESLQASVEEYEEWFNRWRSKENRSVDLKDINISLHDFLNGVIKKHSSLKNEELYWFLRGVLASACQQPDMAISEVQHAEVVNHLRALTNQ